MDQGIGGDCRRAMLRALLLYLISPDRNHCAHSRGLQLGIGVGPLNSSSGAPGITLSLGGHMRASNYTDIISPIKIGSSAMCEASNPIE